MAETYDVFAHARYEVDCEECGDIVILEADPAGDDITCDCGAILHVVETR
jgi:hypothetical protein